MTLQDVIQAYAQASKRLLLLDYDGTLVEFHKEPAMATPTPAVQSVLKRLAGDSRTTVVVISGRLAVTLDEWLGHIPLAFSAEHGFAYKKPAESWQLRTSKSDAWKKPVSDIMQSYVATLPGASLERKSNALSWHWRAAKDQQRATELEQKLHNELIALTSELQVRVLRGHKVIEVHPLGYDKGLAARYWLTQDHFDFILAVGDDTTDEDLFGAIPPTQYTVKIGPGDTIAKLRLTDPKALRAFLHKLAQTGG